MRGSRQLSRAIQEMMSSRAVRRECRQQAEIALRFLKAAAPYDSSPDRNPSTPHYRDNLKIIEERTDRPVFRVVADVPHAVGVEANLGLLKRAARLLR